MPPGLADAVTAEARAAADAVAAAAGEKVARPRFRVLPARLGVYFVLGLCLYAHLPYGQVLRELSGGLRAALAAAGWADPASTALTKLRRRLGERPFELLFWRVASALSPGREPWARICGLLAVAWDGTTVKVPASAANIACFGKPGHCGKNGRGPAAGEAAYPQVRLVSLVACGTRALLGAAIGPLAAGERDLAAGLAGRLAAGMLLLADRGFYRYRLWQAAAGAGADLLWRVQSCPPLPVTRPLPDRSWLSVLNNPAAARRRRELNGQRRRRGSRLPPQAGPRPGAITVRAIEFLLTLTSQDGTVRTGRYRLITTLLDHRRYPAAALAAGYAQRWAIETAALHAVRRTCAGPPARLRQALAATQAEILAHPVPARHGRVCLRAVNEPHAPFPSRHNQKQPLSQHAGRSVTITSHGNTSGPASSQPKQPETRSSQPP